MKTQTKGTKSRRNSGITLIALVITVIILIILAGITIGAITGENGIIKNAQKAKIDYEIAQYIDRVELSRGSVAIDNMGIVTLDNLIEEIYLDKIVPRGNITKLDEIKARMVTVEGYEFIITADDIEHIGNGGVQGELIPTTEGSIIINTPTWNASTHTASVDITKGKNVSETLEIQHQVNGYEEGKWTLGTSVSNLKHGDTVYARLWNGYTGGNYTSQDVRDGVSPKVTVNITGTNTNSITASVSASDAEYGMEEHPTYTFYIKKTSEADTAYVQKQNNTNTSCNFTGLEQTTSYTIKVETKDKAGNKGTGTKTGTTGTVTIASGNVTISTPTWNASTHTASVNITKGSTVASSLSIQYQVNGYEEGKWTQGTSVNNLKHGDTVYARLWDGVNGGNYTSQDVRDGVSPKDATISWTSGTGVTPGANITARIVLRDDESGVSVANSKWELTTSSTTKLGTDASKYSGNFSGTSTTQNITTSKSQAETYYLHVLTQDVAGNKVETIYATGVTVAQSVTGISLNKSSTTIEIGKTETLIATVLPDNASNKNVTWSSSNESIATVSSTGVVTAKQLGKVTITARTQEGNKTASCEVTVDLKAGAYIKYDTGVTTVGENGVVMFRVLYPMNSEYGLQIISDKNVGTNIKLGGSNWDEGKASYNGAIETLNNEAQKYVNKTYAYDGRCVGSIPTVQNGMFVNKNKVRDNEGNIREILDTVSISEACPMPTGWKSRDTGCYDVDTNYEIDETALKRANIWTTGQHYWLASRDVSSGSSRPHFYVRSGRATNVGYSYWMCGVFLSGSRRLLHDWRLDDIWPSSLYFSKIRYHKDNRWRWNK